MKWLKNQPAELSPTDALDMNALQQFWTNPKLDKDEAFLRDYVLNKGWMDMMPTIPTYQEIVDEQPDVSDVSSDCHTYQTPPHCCRMRTPLKSKTILRDSSTLDMKSPTKNWLVENSYCPLLTFSMTDKSVPSYSF